jgi:hypothetical protein
MIKFSEEKKKKKEKRREIALLMEDAPCHQIEISL